MLLFLTVYKGNFQTYVEVEKNYKTAYWFSSAVFICLVCVSNHRTRGRGIPMKTPAPKSNKTVSLCVHLPMRLLMSLWKKSSSNSKKNAKTKRILGVCTYVGLICLFSELSVGSFERQRRNRVWRWLPHGAVAHTSSAMLLADSIPSAQHWAGYWGFSSEPFRRQPDEEVSVSVGN